MQNSGTIFQAFRSRKIKLGDSLHKQDPVKLQVNQNILEPITPERTTSSTHTSFNTANIVMTTYVTEGGSQTDQLISDAYAVHFSTDNLSKSFAIADACGHPDAYEIDKYARRTVNGAVKLLSQFASASEIENQSEQIGIEVERRAHQKGENNKQWNPFGVVFAASKCSFRNKEQDYQYVGISVGDCCTFAYIPNQKRVVPLLNAAERSYGNRFVPDVFAEGACEKPLIVKTTKILPQGAIVFSMTDGAIQALPHVTKNQQGSNGFSYKITQPDLAQLARILEQVDNESPNPTDAIPVEQYIAYLRTVVIKKMEASRKRLIELIQLYKNETLRKRLRPNMNISALQTGTLVKSLITEIKSLSEYQFNTIGDVVDFVESPKLGDDVLIAAERLASREVVLAKAFIVSSCEEERFNLGRQLFTLLSPSSFEHVVQLLIIELNWEVDNTRIANAQTWSYQDLHTKLYDNYQYFSVHAVQLNELDYLEKLTKAFLSCYKNALSLSLEQKKLIVIKAIWMAGVSLNLTDPDPTIAALANLPTTINDNLPDLDTSEENIEQYYQLAKIFLNKKNLVVAIKENLHNLESTCLRMLNNTALPSFYHVHLRKLLVHARNELFKADFDDFKCELDELTKVTSRPNRLALERLILTYLQWAQTNFEIWRNDLLPENRFINLRNMDLGGLDFLKINFSFVDLSGSNLENTNLLRCHLLPEQLAVTKNFHKAKNLSPDLLHSAQDIAFSILKDSLKAIKSEISFNIKAIDIIREHFIALHCDGSMPNVEHIPNDQLGLLVILAASSMTLNTDFKFLEEMIKFDLSTLVSTSRIQCLQYLERLLKLHQFQLSHTLIMRARMSRLIACYNNFENAKDRLNTVNERSICLRDDQIDSLRKKIEKIRKICRSELQTRNEIEISSQQDYVNATLTSIQSLPETLRPQALSEILELAKEPFLIVDMRQLNLSVLTNNMSIRGINIRLSTDQFRTLSAKHKNERQDDLKTAITKQDKKRVEQILDGGVDVNYLDEQMRTPFMTACMTGRRDIAELLLQKGANLKLKTSSGWRIIHGVAVSGYIDVVDLLLENEDEHDLYSAIAVHDFDTAESISTEILQNTPLDEAISLLEDPRTSLPLLHYTLRYNAGYIAKKLISTRRFNLEQRDDRGYTPLLIACEENYLDGVKLLVEEGADLTKKNNQNTTAFELVLLKILETHDKHEFKLRDNFLKIAHYLFLKQSAQGISVTLSSLIILYHFGLIEDTDVRNKIGRDTINNPILNNKTALQLICELGNYALCHYILDNYAHKIQLNQLDNQGRTYLGIACKLGHVELVRILLDAGCDCNAGNTKPLYFSVLNKHVEICRLLISAGAKPDINLGQDTHLLHIAARLGTLEIVKLLVSALAKMDIKADMRNALGNTPLHVASEHGHTAIAGYLANTMIDQMRNREKKSPLDLALVNGHQETMRYLENLGLTTLSAPIIPTSVRPRGQLELAKAYVIQAINDLGANTKKMIPCNKLYSISMPGSETISISRTEISKVAFSHVLSSNYLEDHPLLRTRCGVIELLEKHLCNEALRQIMANDLQSRFIALVRGEWNMNEDPRFPAIINKKFNLWQKNITGEISLDTPHRTIDLMREFCQQPRILEIYLREYMIHDDVAPTLEGLLSAFAQICQITLHCLLEAENETVILLDPVGSKNGQDDIFIIVDKKRTPLSLLEIKVSDQNQYITTALPSIPL